jgi:hypothetical protein
VEITQKMKTTNKNEEYRGTNHTNNVSRPFSNESYKQCGICPSGDEMAPGGAAQTMFFMSIGKHATRKCKAKKP